MNKALRSITSFIIVFAIIAAAFMLMPTVKASAAGSIGYTITYADDSVKVKLTPSSGSDKIYYTTNGSKPTVSSKLYSKRLSLKKTYTIRAIEVNKSGKTVATLKIKVTPKVSVPKLWKSGNETYIRIENKTPGAVIRYTTDGSTPTENSEIYSGPIPIKEGSVVIARAFKKGWKTSNTALYKHVTKVNSTKSEPEQVLEILNGERTSRGLGALKLDDTLCEIAKIRAKEIVKKFDHERPGGEYVFELMKENGIRYTSAAENIAKGQPNAESVMATWMKSEGHRNNILNSRFGHIGIACYTDSNGYKYWVEVFMN